MKNGLSLAVAIGVIFVLASAAFTVQEHQQALIIQLGKVQGEPITQAGLHWKIPFFQEVKFFEKRILQWDGERGEIPTLDKKFIWVDTTARWRIKEPLKFYRAVRDIYNASLRMGTVLDGVTNVTAANINHLANVESSIKDDLTARYTKLQADDIFKFLTNSSASIEDSSLVY